MEMKTLIRNYRELNKLHTFEARFEYLDLSSIIGEDTFGFDRYLNQIFYTSKEWREIRKKVIIRDNGCDLGLQGYPISGLITIHHMMPITKDDIINVTDYLVDPDYLISVSDRTHKAIHYGRLDNIIFKAEDRKPNDTCLWRI